MWTFQIFLLAFSTLWLVDGKVEDQCGLINTLMNKFGVSRTNAAHWACLAKFASGYNTKAIGETHTDGSEDFGIFKINDKYCKKGAKNSCGVGCSDLVSDDITPSATCALQIFKKEGFKHWPAWNDNCRNINVSRFVDKCDRKPK